TLKGRSHARRGARVDTGALHLVTGPFVGVAGAVAEYFVAQTSLPLNIHREIGRVMILVIGGRSKIGSAVLDQLGRRGASVRALARSSEPSAAFPLPIETVTGDLGDPASLEAAMQGVEQVVILCGPTPDELTRN